jgi:hypothetical protein
MTSRPHYRDADAETGAFRLWLAIREAKWPPGPINALIHANEEVLMPDLLPDGLPDRASRSKFDFAQWADGQAWKFVKGSDYESSTETFRANVKRWAKLNGHEVELRPYPALDRAGREVPLIKSDGIALGVRFVSNGRSRNGGDADVRRGAAAGGERPATR